MDSIKDQVQALAFLADSMSGGVDYAADRLEGGEQSKIVASTVLPKEVRRRDQWEALGIVFGEDVDDLFCKATFPEGWNVKATDHNMWNDIIDDQGRRRGAFFYKGSFWDRSAHMNSPESRYRATADSIPDTHARAIVTDGGVEIWSTPTVSVGGRKRYEVRDALVAEAGKWLEEHYPEHANPLAYWD